MNGCGNSPGQSFGAVVGASRSINAETLLRRCNRMDSLRYKYDLIKSKMSWFFEILFYFTLKMILRQFVRSFDFHWYYKVIGKHNWPMQLINL